MGFTIFGIEIGPSTLKETLGGGLQFLYDPKM